MRVRWSRTALRNLDAEAELIAESDPAAGRWFVERALKAVAMLASQPGPGRGPRG